MPGAAACGDRPVDLYTSESLKSRFPAGPGTGGEPGDLIVLYRVRPPDSRVTSIVIAIGNNP